MQLRPEEILGELQQRFPTELELCVNAVALRHVQAELAALKAGSDTEESESVVD